MKYLLLIILVFIVGSIPGLREVMAIFLICSAVGDIVSFQKNVADENTNKIIKAIRENSINDS